MPDWSAEKTLARIRKFLHAYATGQAMTFVDPRSGLLISATTEARALADACLEGPAANSPADYTTEVVRLKVANRKMFEALERIALWCQDANGVPTPMGLGTVEAIHAKARTALGKPNG